VEKHRYLRFVVCLFLSGLALTEAHSQSKPNPDELVKLAEKLIQAAKDGDRAPFEQLQIPNSESWFARALGDRAGQDFGPIYNRIAPKIPGMVHARFLEISSKENVEFKAASWKSLKGLERTDQPAALAVWTVSRRPEELFALWFTAKDERKKFLGFWCHVDGDFRFVGWLYLARTKTGDSLLLLPPDAKIQEVSTPEKNPVPPYPRLARQARIAGTVTLKAVVADDGTLDDIAVISGHPLLVESSLDTVRKWRYTPLIVNGQVIEAVLVIELRYTIS